MSDDLLRRYGYALAGERHCHATTDGECFWPKCPQMRDGEPRATGRHCPLDMDTTENPTEEP